MIEFDTESKMWVYNKEKVPLKYRFRSMIRTISGLRLRHLLYLIVYPFLKLKFFIIERKVRKEEKKGEYNYLKKALAKSIIKGRPILPL